MREFKEKQDIGCLVVWNMEICTLEEILCVLGSATPFQEKVELDIDGHKQPFTASGAFAYGKLISILYAVGNITDTKIESIIEALDEISCE